MDCQGKAEVVELGLECYELTLDLLGGDLGPASAELGDPAEVNGFIGASKIPSVWDS